MNNISDEDVWAFSLVSEIELKANEEKLLKQVEQTNHEKNKTQAEMQEKLLGLKSMIMPLLLNLQRDPDKEYIRWEGKDRVQKITQFIDKITKYCNE